MTAATAGLMALVLAGALLAVNLRNILHAIFGLAIALLGTAGLFVILGAPFLAVMQVLIYIGGISIAMIFAVMLSSVADKRDGEPVGRRLLGAGICVLLYSGIAHIINNTIIPDAVVPNSSSVRDIGEQLLNRYNVVFETLSAILLLAIIGAIVISRKPRAPLAPEEEST